MRQREQQRFTQRFIWVLLIFVLVMTAVAKYYTYCLKEPFGNALPTDELLRVSDYALAAVLLIFMSARLITEVDEKELRFKYLPFIPWWKRYPWNEMESFEVVDYDPLDEFLGWGIRYNFKTWCYNVKGNKGLRIKMKSGKQVLIGTQKPEAYAHLSKRMAQ